MRLSRQGKHRRADAEEIDQEGTWAISYGDMITLLLSFFVIFFTTDPQKEKRKSMNDFLHFEIENLQGSSSELKKSVEKDNTQAVKTIDNLQIDQSLDVENPMNVDVKSIGESLVVSFNNVSFFSSGQIDINQKSKDLLEKFAQKYIPFAGKYRLSVKAFTDVRPVKSSKRKYRDNLELSVMRSISAMRVLQQSGIPLNRMMIAGMGELEKIHQVHDLKSGLDEKEKLALARTIVLVIVPDLTDSILKNEVI